MCTQVMNIAEDFVRNRARLNTNILLLHHLHQVWMHSQAKAMADSLRSQQDSIIELRVGTLIRLTSVQIQLEAISKLHLHSHDLVEEMIGRRVVVFFTNHIKSRDQVGHGVSCDDIIQLRLDVVSSE